MQGQFYAKGVINIKRLWLRLRGWMRCLTGRMPIPRFVRSERHGSQSKRGFGGLELLEHLADWNSSGDSIAIDATANFLAFKIVDSKNWVAAIVFVEPFEMSSGAEGVDEHRHEISRCCNYLSVGKRTACEVTTARSARVLAEMQPHRSIGSSCVG